MKRTWLHCADHVLFLLVCGCRERISSVPENAECINAFPTDCVFSARNGRRNANFKKPDCVFCGRYRTRFAFFPPSVGGKNRCSRQFANWRQQQSTGLVQHLSRIVSPGCTAPKPPLCKGRWAAERRLGGVDNPSVKNQRFLPAPFTQGSLGRSRASASNNNFSLC